MVLGHFYFFFYAHFYLYSYLATFFLEKSLAQLVREMNFSGEIDELRKKRRRDEAEASQKIGERKNFLGEPARTIGVDPDERKRVRKAEDELKEAQRNLRIKLDAYIAKSDAFRAAQREAACKLQNPAEMAVVNQQQEIQELLRRSPARPRQAPRPESHRNAGDCRNRIGRVRSQSEYGRRTQARAHLCRQKHRPRGTQGRLGRPRIGTASRDLSTIVVSRGCICVAVDEKGDTIALYRINSEKVAVYNVDEDRIVRELESCVSQGRGHVFRDVGTMAFVGGIEYYVVNLTRFSARVGSGTVSKKRISNQMICHGNVRETVRINRFSEGAANPPFLPGRQHSCRSGHRPSLFTSKASSEK